ncbi:MAG: hypothetical protein HYV63_18625 [Candidatus Schekmanbacteria bacterium]|nr:hypothetical protein [Candidatus Schekmanbacteria bacterium]
MTVDGVNNTSPAQPTSYTPASLPSQPSAPQAPAEEGDATAAPASSQPTAADTMEDTDGAGRAAVSPASEQQARRFAERPRKSEDAGSADQEPSSGPANVQQLAAKARRGAQVRPKSAPAPGTDRQTPVDAADLRKRYDKFVQDSGGPSATPSRDAAWLGTAYGINDPTSRAQLDEAMKHVSPYLASQERAQVYARLVDLTRQGKLDWVGRAMSGDVKGHAINTLIASPGTADAVHKMVSNSAFHNQLVSTNAQKALITAAGLRGEKANNLLQQSAFRTAPYPEKMRIVRALMLSGTWDGSDVAGLRKLTAELPAKLQSARDAKPFLGRGPIMKDIATELTLKPWALYALDRKTQTGLVGELFDRFASGDAARSRADEHHALRGAFSALKNDNPALYRATIGGALRQAGAVDPTSQLYSLGGGAGADVVTRLLAKKFGGPAAELAGPVVSGLFGGGASAAGGSSSSAALRDAYLTYIVSGVLTMAGAPGIMGILGTVPFELANLFARNSNIKRGAQQYMLSDPSINPFA